MAKYLVTYTDQINDVEITGFKAMTEKEVDGLEKLLGVIKWSFNYPVTNFEIEFIDGEDYLSKLDFKEITNEEFRSLNKLFKEGFGIFISHEFLEQIYNEDDSFEDDDFDGYGDDYDVARWED